MIRRRTPALAAALALWICACAPINQDRAQTDLAQGQLDDAVDDIQAALQHDPDNLQLKSLAAEIFTRRGVTYYQGGQMIAAANDFNAAVGYNPTYAPAYDYLGMIAFQQHDWQNAINYGTKAAGLEGKSDPGYVQMARTELAKVRSGGLPPPPARHRPPARRIY
jgi:tetratricopeptide (TPR) repeat protein